MYRKIFNLMLQLSVTLSKPSFFWMRNISSWNIEPFFVTVSLLGDLRTNQRLLRFTTLWSVAVFPVSDQWEQRVGLLVDDNALDLLADLHSQIDLKKDVFIFITTVSRVFPYTSFVLCRFLRTLQQKRTQSKLRYWLLLFFYYFYYFNCIVLHSWVR